MNFENKKNWRRNIKIRKIRKGIERDSLEDVSILKKWSLLINKIDFLERLDLFVLV